MTPEAHLATSADLVAAARVLEQASSAVRLERGGSVFVDREFVAPPYEERLGLFLNDPATCLAVGTLEDVIAGIAIAVVETLRDSSRLARLEILWVEPEAREIGLGEALVDVVTSWASGLGASHLDAYALPGGRETKNFLEAAGFSARLIVMHRRLGDHDAL